MWPLTTNVVTRAALTLRDAPPTMMTMRNLTKTLWFAAAGVALALAVLYATDGRNPIYETDTGNKALQKAMEATAPATPPGLEVAKEGEIIPNLKLKDLDGKEHELRTAIKKPTLVNFWATWCGPCIEEIPELVEFATNQTDIEVLGIALDEPDAAKQFVERFNMKYPQLYDEVGPRDASVSLGNPRGVLPYSVLIDADGRLIKQKIGPFHKGDIEKWVAPK